METNKALTELSNIKMQMEGFKKATGVKPLITKVRNKIEFIESHTEDYRLNTLMVNEARKDLKWAKTLSVVTT